jgi:hypothetical protein
MNDLRVASHFQRPDVDAFIDEIDAEQWAEWSDFLLLEPQGWQALRIAIQRLSYMLAATHSTKRVKERDYAIEIGGNMHSAEADRARWEAMSIRHTMQGEDSGG